MTAPIERTETEFWNFLHAARIPLRLAYDHRNLHSRLQMREFSESAYLHRMFDLFFWGMRLPEVMKRLSDEERAALREFIDFFDRLPWQPLAGKPHISELVGTEVAVLAPLAKRLDRMLWLRTSRGIVPWFWRTLKHCPKPVQTGIRITRNTIGPYDAKLIEGSGQCPGLNGNQRR